MFDKMMKRMFRKVEGVVYDMTTNSIGIKKDGSVFTMSSDTCELNENLFEDMSASIPAFAKAVPLANVKVGDLVVSQAGEPFGFVTKVNEKSLGVLKPNGTVSTVSPAKVNLLGQGQTMMVVSPLAGGVGGMDPMMLMALTDDEGDNSELFMLMSLMNQPAGTSDANNVMSNPLMMMALMKSGDKSSGPSDIMKMMMMQQMMGQQPQAGGMNPMMMALLMGKMKG